MNRYNHLEDILYFQARRVRSEGKESYLEVVTGKEDQDEYSEIYTKVYRSH